MAKMVLLRRLIKLCSSNNWYSKTDAKQLQQYVIDLKLLRCEKIFQFYSDKRPLPILKNNNIWPPKNITFMYFMP